MARNGATRWFEELPIALLGLKSVYKENISATPAEMVYGQNLRLSREILIPNPKDCSSEVLNKLKERFQNVQSAINHHKTPNTGIFVPKQLKDCKFVFVRCMNTKSLQQPYDGPYEVVGKEPKTFKVNINGDIKSYPIDRLKPAIVEKQNTQQTTQTNTTNTKPKKHVTFNLLPINFPGGVVV